MSILEAKNVSIRYITGDFKDIGLKEYLLRRIRHDYQVTEFWADMDVSFTLETGEMLGIIGANGAGKSTLLKAVSGIMEPTRGTIHREGSIAALLELGSGFDGDLTVKENTYLRGAMLGYTRSFMDETYEEIIDFAELREFEDRPFKQLSSGMKSRLAFSVACLVEPDILILDEVLSVGDGAFRKKSEAKMREIIDGGATTILVSHSLGQVRINFYSLIKVVDILGGIDVNLTEQEAWYINAMANGDSVGRYLYHGFIRDKDSKNEITELKEGMNHLNGEYALCYARLRAIDSDWHRVERQRTVIQACVDKIGNASVSTLNKLLDEILPLVQTNFTESEIAGLMLKAPGFLNVKFEQLTIPVEGTYSGMLGLNSISLLAPDYQTNAKALQEFLYGKSNITG